MSINTTAHFDWLLSLSHSSVNLALSATSWFDLSGDCSAASKMANNPQRFFLFANRIVKE